MNDFYTIETPPSSSSTSKDSLDEYFSLYQTNARVQVVSTNHEQISQDTMKIDEVSCFSKSTSLPAPVFDVPLNSLISFSFFHKIMTRVGLVFFE